MDDTTSITTNIGGLVSSADLGRPLAMDEDALIVIGTTVYEPSTCIKRVSELILPKRNHDRNHDRSMRLGQTDDNDDDDDDPDWPGDNRLYEVCKLLSIVVLMNILIYCLCYSASLRHATTATSARAPGTAATSKAENSMRLAAIASSAMLSMIRKRSGASVPWSRVVLILLLAIVASSGRSMMSLLV